MAYDPTLVKNVYHPDLARAAYEREAAVDPQAWRNWEHEYEGNVFSLSEAPPEIYWVNYCLRRSPTAPTANPASGKVIEREGEDNAGAWIMRPGGRPTLIAPSDKVLVSREAAIAAAIGHLQDADNLAMPIRVRNQIWKALAALRSELEGGE